jgi:sulfonate transport system substrate-binding protein
MKIFAILSQRIVCLFLAGFLGFVMLSSCTNTAANKLTTIRLDYAYYNPLSIVIKEKKYLEQEFEKDGIKIEWVHSLGSNKALEFLNSRSIDFGSTAGAAALIGKANGNPLKAIYVYSKPEWTALVTKANSKITKIEDLKGKRVAATKGTDPYIFLLRALNSVGLSEKDIQLVPLQHPDGKAALERGDVDAWAGLDPLMAQTEIEQGSRLFFRNKDWNTYGVLNVREVFAQQHPEYVDRVLKTYETARKWTLANPDELKTIWAKEAKISDKVVAKQLERVDLSSPAIGEVQKNVIAAAGDVLQKGGVIDKTTNISQLVDSLIDDQYAAKVVQK